MAAALPSSFKREGRITVFASESGAQVLLDGKAVGEAPIRGLSVKGGRHEISVRLAPCAP